MENLDPPPSPPNQRWKNGAFLPFARLHPWFGGGWGFAVPFYFVQDCNIGQNKWKTLTPPPPESKMEKWRVFALRAASSLIWGGWGLLFHFILSKIAILDKINGKPWPPPPPQIKDGKMARFCRSRGFILDLGRMGVCCSILFCPRLWFPERPYVFCYSSRLSLQHTSTATKNTLKRSKSKHSTQYLRTNLIIILKTTEWLIYKVLSLYYLHLLPPLAAASLLG